METKLRTLKDVATLLSIKPYRIAYVLAVKHVPEPAHRFGNKRQFTERDIQRLRAFFSAKLEPSTTSISHDETETEVCAAS